MDTNGFELIGNLSTMITAAFNEQTIREQTVTAIDTRHEPEVFGITIPKDYKVRFCHFGEFNSNPILILRLNKFMNRGVSPLFIGDYAASFAT
jgi:hypothetical protein